MDNRAAFNGDARSEDHVRLDQDILSNLRIESQENGFRRDHRHTGDHHLVTAALLPDCLDHGQFGAIVAAGQFCLRRLNGDRLAAFGTNDFNDIGQVVFALGIGIADLAKQFQRLGAVDRHQATVAIGNLSFVLGRIFLLADRHKRAILDDEPAVSSRISGLKADNDNIVAIGQPLACGQKRCCGDQRGITEHHENIVEAVGDGLLCRKNGMACPEAFGLQECRHVDVLAGGSGLNGFGITAKNKRHGGNRRIDQGFHHVRDHRPAGDRMQHLRHG